MKTEQNDVGSAWGTHLSNALSSGRTKFINSTLTQSIAPPEMPSAWKDIEERHLSLEAHVREGIAWQVRVNREERGLTQKDLAKLVGTGQSAISKLEDPQGGDVRLSSLLRVARGLDCALLVRLVGFTEFWGQVASPRGERLLAPSYGSEASPLVRHVSDLVVSIGRE